MTAWTARANFCAVAVALGSSHVDRVSLSYAMQASPSIRGDFQHDELGSHLTLTIELALDEDNTVRDLQHISGCSKQSHKQARNAGKP